MAGKAKMEYGGASFLAISWDNSRKCMFKDDEAKRAFEESLAAALSGWDG